MTEYGLAIEPETPNEAFEALADVMGDRVFTLEEGIECIANVLGIEYSEAAERLYRLIRNENVSVV